MLAPPQRPYIGPKWNLLAISKVLLYTNLLSSFYDIIWLLWDSISSFVLAFIAFILCCNDSLGPNVVIPYTAANIAVTINSPIMEIPPHMIVVWYVSFHINIKNTVYIYFELNCATVSIQLAFLFRSISLHLLLLGVSLSCIPQHGQNNPSLYK